MGHGLVTFALGPVLLLQGGWVRWRVPRLPEPPGPRAGTAGEGVPVRLLIAGDSAAAGVGASTQSEALAGQLVDRLQSRFRVEWRLEAETGATTREMIHRLGSLGDATFDVLVTSLGVNDITRGARTGPWLENQRRLRTVARERLGVSVLVISGLPPVDGFPALPNPLRRYLGNRARLLSTLLEKDLEGEPWAHFLDLRFTRDPSGMAVDGFHPGPAIYREWADRAAEVIAREWPPPEQAGRRMP